ncbi:hypothetical protein DSECCO2_310800 [anaerobic digester metagenome]
MGARGAGDEVDLGHLEQLAQDELSAPVAVDEGGDDPLLAEVHDGLGNVGPFHSDGVLDARLQQVQHVGAALHHDDGVGLGHVRSRRQAVLAVVGYLFHLYGLAHALGEVDPGGLGLLYELGQKLPCPLDDLLALDDAHVLDGLHAYLGLARAHPVDGLQRGRQNNGLHLI